MEFLGLLPFYIVCLEGLTQATQRLVSFTGNPCNALYVQVVNIYFQLATFAL